MPECTWKSEDDIGLCLLPYLGYGFFLVSLWIPGWIDYKLSQTLLVLPFVLLWTAGILVTFFS